MKRMKHLMTYESYCVLGALETVIVSNGQGQSVTRTARIDTGSLSSRISLDIASELKLPVVDHKKIWSTLGEEDRAFVECQLNICGVEIKTVVGIADTTGIKHEVSIGRRDIEMLDALIDLNKDKVIDNIPVIPSELPIDASQPIVNVVMTEDDLDIISQNPNVTVETQPNIMNMNQFISKNIQQ